MGYALWPKPYHLRCFSTREMRIADDIRNAVVFIGTADGNGGFSAAGTAFFVVHKNNRYIVTNKHIAAGIGDNPFAIRFNKLDGDSDNLLIDPITDTDFRWYTSADMDVDLAVMPFNYDFKELRYTCKSMPSDLFADGHVEGGDIGAGDFCHIVGLFRLMAGKTKNIPFVHSGNIALMPGDEKVPVRDWMNQGQRREIEAYLVEATNLKGLSGSPVFVRPLVVWDGVDTTHGKHTVVLPRSDVLFLGVWQGSWDAPPDDIMAVESGQYVRVPVGVGIVIPASKLRELLDSDDVQRQRSEFAERIAHMSAAAPDTQQPVS